MDNNSGYIKRQLPVLIGYGSQQVMASAEIFKSPDKILIQITSTGTEGQYLREFLEQAEPIALSFGAIPVQNIREKREIN